MWGRRAGARRPAEAPGVAYQGRAAVQGGLTVARVVAVLVNANRASGAAFAAALAALP